MPVQHDMTVWSQQGIPPAPVIMQSIMEFNSKIITDRKFKEKNMYQTSKLKYKLCISS
jgi:hypothetical protein